ncbi:MAG TPA: Crp/Fnr family transcriptional regulator [Thermotogota bacterium]|nr:Crp/Fnr family transcriptional regulator [Thermotogota bacterium]HPJ89188.1 Crp/Fnr family transcriptional regulator [Thermotogota bacterium]HPR95649.1 Crp/Fnr family transcriptional regulator [Thermotogota bacterium]
MNKLMLNLSKSALFTNLTVEELEEISNSLRINTTQYYEEELIEAHDEKENRVFVLLEGKIKGVMEDINGHIFQVEEFSESDVVAPANLFASEIFLPISLIAKTDCKLISFDCKQILFMFSISQQLEKNFLGILSDKVMFLAERLWENQFFSIEEKLYKFIYTRYLDCQKEEFEIEQTHEELAHRFGVSRPSLSRSLVRINQMGIINSKGKKIKILNMDKLLRKIE